MDNQNNKNKETCSVSNHLPGELEVMLGQAMIIGPKTAEYMDRLIHSTGFKESMLGACKGILRLARICGRNRIEAACCRGLQGDKYNLKVIKQILDNKLEGQPLTQPPCGGFVQTKAHEHLRGEQSFT